MKTSKLHRHDTRRAERRHWLQRTLVLAALACTALPRARAAALYAATAAALRSAQETEMAVYYRYTEFSRKARHEGYLGIAYLFSAFAQAELIHATNFGRILARLDVEVSPLPKPEVKAGSTRDNLIAAADVEIRSVDHFYPLLLEKIRAEGHEDAMAAVRWAWATEQRHRDKIRQVQRWSPTFFEQVAKAIDAKTGQYYVCQICGCTLNALPVDNCPVCRNLPRHYRHIEPPA